MIRVARPEDMPAMTAIRISVTENHMSIAQMAERGITAEATLAEMAVGHLGAWVAEDAGGIVAFAMADRRDASLFALFTKPGCEGRGHGSALLTAAETWLGERGHKEAWLTTASDSRAAIFYVRKGWRATDEGDPGDTLFRKTLEHRPEKCVRFSEEPMRKYKEIERRGDSNGTPGALTG